MCKFACCFVWTQNLVSHIKGRTLADVENRVLGKVFGLRMEEVTGGIVRSFMTYSSSNTIMVSKSWTMRWAEHVSCTGNNKTTWGGDYM